MSLRSSFSMESLKKLWNEYALKMKQDKRDIEHAILFNRALQLDDDFNVTISLENNIQADQLNSFKADLAEFLRRGLKNNHVMIRAVIKEAEAQKLIYTSEDKLKFLAEKYPLVDDLKKRLGLDTDF